MDLRRKIRRLALEVGFVDCGVASARGLPRERFLGDWIAAGLAGGMDYIARRVRERLDPRERADWVRGIISVAWPYGPPPAPAPDWQWSLTGRVSAYARGRDYHRLVSRALRRLAAALGREHPGARILAYVDTGPVLEREWGYRAGLGWFGKNTMLIDRTRGSYFFLGELLVSLPLTEADEPSRSFCGTCRRCIESCPTGALADGYLLDARRCISYLTIENRGPIPSELRPRLGNWVFGCDVCQEVCPWNPAPGPPEPELLPSLVELLMLDEKAFKARFSGTALARARRAGLARNAAVALGNSRNPEACVPLASSLVSDPDPIVRAHAAWALGRLGGSAARAALERARRREADPAAAAEMEAAQRALG